MLEQQLSAALIVPVITFDDADDAEPLARVFCNAGLTLIEVALRSDAALNAIQSICRAQLPISVAAGTVRTPHDMQAAAAAGATLMISPGSTPVLIEAARRTGVPWLPGVSTPSDVMALAESGYHIQKLFPANPPAGLALLDTLAGPFPDIRFVPTGGIDADTMRDFFSRPNVLAVAGSWIAPRNAIRAHAWGDIHDRAAAALAVARRLATTH
jgi:2-dehydro-3-deoxyphosphogluconate aldolase/(4S)-4-hydroxy-2-oxoglutarate aldolase